MVAVNLQGAALCAKHLLPFMAVRRDASSPPPKTRKLVIVSSVLSQRATPPFAVYTSTKASLDHLAWSLRTEFADSNVAVQLLLPGATRTGFHQKAGIPEGAMDKTAFAAAPDMARRLCEHVDTSDEFQAGGK